MIRPLLSASKPDSPFTSPKIQGASTFAPLPKKAALSVSLLGPTVAFTQPPQNLEDPGVEAQVAGTVTLQLPKLTRVQELTVELVGTANLGLDVGYETGEVLKQSFRLLHDDVCVPGEHIFEFCFSVPPTAAPHEQSVHGRVHHRIIARAKMGKFEPDLKAETLIGIVAAPKEMDASLFFRTENYHDELGPFTFGLSSSCLCVGGIVSISFGLQGPPEPVTIDHVDLSIVQNFTLTSLSKRLTSTGSSLTSQSYLSESFPPHRIKVLRLDGHNLGKGLQTTHGEAKIVGPRKEEEDEKLARGESQQKKSPKGKAKAVEPVAPPPLARLEAGEPREFWHQIRLPRCKVLRPSTPAWVISPIHKTHEIEAVIFYHTSSGEAKVLKIRKPVEIVSCSCILSNLVLPAYNRHGPTPDYEADPANAHNVCSCSIATNVLMESERQCGASVFSDPDSMTRIKQPRPKYEETT